MYHLFCGHYHYINCHIISIYTKNLFNIRELCFLIQISTCRHKLATCDHSKNACTIVSTSLQCKHNGSGTKSNLMLWFVSHYPIMHLSHKKLYKLGECVTCSTIVNFKESATVLGSTSSIILVDHFA